MLENLNKELQTIKINLSEIIEAYKNKIVDTLYDGNIKIEYDRKDIEINIIANNKNYIITSDEINCKYHIEIYLIGDKNGNLIIINNQKYICHARRSGEGHGHCIVSGSGDGYANRNGNGHGHAIKSGIGEGHSYHNGGGHGNAIRLSSGNGNSYHIGRCFGNAIRLGSGSGDALQENESNGHAVKLGSGYGNALHISNGTGYAIKSGSGEGSVFNNKNKEGHDLH